MYLHAPGLLPDSLSYYLYGTESELNNYLHEIIEFVLRGSTFLGYCQELEGIDFSRHYVIVAEPVCLAEIPGNATGCFDRIIVLPVPVGDTWSYWEVGKHILLLLQSEVNSLTGKIDKNDLYGFFAQYRSGFYGISPDGSLVIRNNEAYMCSFSEAFREYAGVIDYIVSMLSDIKSKSIYGNMFYGRPFHMWDHYFRNLFDTVQYCDYINLMPGDIILNGGIFNGTEIPFLINAIRGTGQIHNIDPLGSVFMTDYAKKYVENNKICFFYDMALGGYDGTVALPIGGNNDQAIGRLSNNNNTGMRTENFPCMTIDSFAAKHLTRVDYIKLDLEGAEPDVIKHMMTTVQCHRPMMAISIYHSISDFIEIPYLLMKTLRDYLFYVEVYSFERYETILYCIPNERRLSSKRFVSLSV